MSWTQACLNTFEQDKKELISAKALAHCGPDLPMKMAANASAYGVGVSSLMFILMKMNVLLHLLPGP